MPAQILPIVEDSTNALAAQQQQFQQRLQQSQLQLQQAQFQAEQQLAPFRQQILQNEFQRSQQAVQQGAQEFAKGQFELERAKQRAPLEDALANAQLKEQKQKSADYEEDTPFRAQRRQNEVDQAELSKQLTGEQIKGAQANTKQTEVVTSNSIEANYRANQEAQLKQQLGQAELDQRGQDLLRGKQAAMMAILALPTKGKRDAMADANLRSGLIDQKTHDDIVALPEDQKEFYQNIAQVLGPVQADIYKGLAQAVEKGTKGYDDKGNETVLLNEAAMKAMNEIGLHYLDALNSKSKALNAAPPLPSDLNSRQKGQVYSVPLPGKPGQTQALKYLGDGKWEKP